MDKSIVDLNNALLWIQTVLINITTETTASFLLPDQAFSLFITIGWSFGQWWLQFRCWKIVR